MNEQEEAIVELARALKAGQLAFMLVGGHANAVWGTPRVTLDVDVTIWASDEDAAHVARTLSPGFQSLVSEPAAFVRETRVLPMRSNRGVRVDVIFGLLPFEEEAIRRARNVEIAGIHVPVCSPEDLIIMKIVSSRPRDLDDARGVIDVRLGDLDLGYLEPRLEALAETLARPEILERWHEWSAASKQRPTR